MKVAGIRRVLHLALVSVPLFLASVTAALLLATGADDDDIGFAIDSAERHLRTIKLERESLELSLTAYGEVRAAQSTVLKAEVMGKVIDINPALESGYPLSKGEVLVRIEDWEYRQQLAQARENLAHARLTLAEEEARKAQAEEDLASLPEEMQTALAFRKPQMQLAQARVASALAEVELARQNLERTQVLAPYDGFVTRRLVSLGDYLSQGDEILEIYQGERLLIDTALSKFQVSQLNHMAQAVDGESPRERSGSLPGLQVTVEDDWGSDLYRYEVNDILFGAKLHPQSRQQPVTLTLEQPEKAGQRQLLPGSSVTTLFAMGRLKDVFRLSKSTLSDFQPGLFADAETSAGSWLDLPVLNQQEEVVEQRLRVVYQTQTDLYLRPNNAMQTMNLVLNSPELKNNSIEHLSHLAAGQEKAAGREVSHVF